MEDDSDMPSEAPKGRIRGSKNKDIATLNAERKASRRPVGRPKGGNLINNAFLNISKKDEKEIIQALVQVAKDPDHKNYSHASKMVVDRLAHLSHFEKDKADNHKGGITINIQGITKAEVIEDADFQDIDS